MFVFSSTTLKELKWFKGLLADLGVPLNGSMEMHCDNQSALHIAVNLVIHERTRYIESDCHSVRDAVRDHFIATKHVHTTEQLADVLTKTLGSFSFDYLLTKLDVHNLHAPN